MDLAPPLLRAAEELYGLPRGASLSQEIAGWEMDLIDRVCGERRFHDVTVFVLSEGALALVHKPSDPEGAFWAPGGGLDEGETLADGVRREVWEETGLTVEPQRYVLRLNVLFSSGGRSRPWTSHVFLARPVGGALGPIDTREVERAEWVGLGRFRDEVAPILRRSGWGRYEYRLAMAGMVFEELGLPMLDGSVGGRPPSGAEG